MKMETLEKAKNIQSKLKTAEDYLKKLQEAYESKHGVRVNFVSCDRSVGVCSFTYKHQETEEGKSYCEFPKTVVRMAITHLTHRVNMLRIQLEAL
jgi:hypothetical protein